ncbi:hypothetical protein BU16DRAFT_619727 [Lophium mytilinum]|uniref:C3H1-type domain-containing protein n=1 Tax=Lophium mytilinum TaxID=390894 RepID=A0A6A6QNS2_9PEZI|nr:hypothetical protein BU16DRAFT_619727 [Lophium mytilinum]
MASNPVLRWAITRQGGGIVPLIPADELPPEVQLQGMPRILAFSDLSGQKLEFIETDAPAMTRTYQLAARMNMVAPPPATQYTAPVFQAPDALTRPIAGKDVEDVARGNFIPQSQSSSFPLSSGLRYSAVGPMARESWRSQHPTPSVAPGRSISDAIASIDPAAAERIGYPGARHPPPSGVDPDSSKKVYCTYWIRTGECDYMQQGCIYKHEMPSPAKLRELGFKEVPRWWKEKNAIIPGQGVLRPAIRDLSWVHRGGRPDEAVFDSSSDESDGAQNVQTPKSLPSATIPTDATATLKAKPSKTEKSPLPEDIPELAPPLYSQDDSSSSTTTSMPRTPPMPQDVDLISLEDDDLHSLDEPACLIPSKPEHASSRLQQTPDRSSNHRVSQRNVSAECKATEPTVSYPLKASKARVVRPSTPRAGRNEPTEAASPSKILPHERRERRSTEKDAPSTGLSTSKFASAAQDPRKAKAVVAPNSSGAGQQVREHRTEAHRNAARHQQSRTSNSTHRTLPEVADVPTSINKRGYPPSNAGGRKKPTPRATRKTVFVPATEPRPVAQPPKATT